MLKVRMLQKHLQDHLVLDELDMEVEDGCIYGLIGPNGAGKSTLLRVIAGVYQPDLGCVTIDDVKVHEHPSQLAQILLISDDPFYFHNASLLDMKKFYQIAHPNMDDEYYHHLITLFHIDDHAPLQNFSKGMKRQAFLILGLCASPRYLLLDEAFDGLDPHMRLLFKKEIAQRLEDRQMSVIISSHNLREMEEVCDRFGILEDGRLLTSGSVSERLHQVHRFQLAFKEEMREQAFQHIPILSLSIDSRIVNLVAEGDQEELETEIKKLSPVMLETLPVSLEEVFVYVMMKKEEHKDD